MRKAFVLVWLLFISGIPLPVKAETPVQPVPSAAVTIEEVRQFMEEYKNRLKKMEVDPFMELFSREAVENQVLPYADIRQGYLATFENSDAILYHLDVYSIQTRPEGALVSGRYEMIQSLKGRSKQKTFRGNIQWDLVREGGLLKIKELKYGRDPE
ncbi:MAG: hypothetical protein A2170_05070 [Deltaproteobacteria bacterium RBG_13_53_10]|nr:MAG: hypothetical protein A2170_05070 [Deltaproteobacteria bacterium RBG_13_53_10]